MVHGVWSYNPNREKLEDLPYPWESFVTKEQISRIIDIGNNTQGVEWDFFIKIPFSKKNKKASSYYAVEYIKENFGNESKIVTNIEEEVKKMKQDVGNIIIAVASNIFGSKIIEQNPEKARLYGVNLPIGVNLRIPIANIFFDSRKNEPTGDFKLASYDRWRMHQDLCRTDLEEMYFLLGNMVSKICYGMNLENKIKYAKPLRYWKE